MAFVKLRLSKAAWLLLLALSLVMCIGSAATMPEKIGWSIMQATASCNFSMYDKFAESRSPWVSSMSKQLAAPAAAGLTSDFAFFLGAMAIRRALGATAE